MIESVLLLLFTLAVIVSVASIILLKGYPEASFLLALVGVVMFVATAYGANFIEIYQVTTPVANTTNPDVVVGLPVITRSPALMWLSGFGMFFDGIILYLAATLAGIGR